jgi:hypothetical protein
MQVLIHRPRFIAKFVLVTALLVAGAFAASSATDARADTQWFGSYESKTYRNNWANYPTGPITTAYCGGGLWGGTYNTSSYDKGIYMWTNKWDQGTFYWDWDWRYGEDHSLLHWYNSTPVEVNAYHGRCTRGASDHYGYGTYLGTTSDGF